MHMYVCLCVCVCVVCVCVCVSHTWYSIVVAILQYEQSPKTLFFQLILMQNYNGLHFPLVATVNNSYYTRFNVYLSTQKFYFCRE